MVSKRAYKIQRILIFLIGIVGLLYISMYLINWLQGARLREGFQATTIPPTCTETYINGKDMFLCSPQVSLDPISGLPTDITASGSNDARSILSLVPVTSSVCYTDSYTLMNRRSGMSSFVCFDRPGASVWDSSSGHYRDFDAVLDNDQLPAIEIQTVLGFCSAYNAGFQKNLAAYSTVSTTEILMYKMGFSNLYDNLNNLRGIHSQYCSAPAPNTNIATVCASNLATMQTLSNVINNNSVGSLSNVSTTLGTSRSTIGGLIYGTLVPNFYNAGCM